MKERIEVQYEKWLKYLKGFDIVKASSFEDEIRFYINQREYVTVIEDKAKNTYQIELGKEENMKIKIKTKFFFKVLISVILKLLIEILIIIKNIYIIIPIILLLFSILKERIISSQTLRSKHAAEHMMINFLKKNKRLPKTIEEVKQASRFTLNCSSQYKAEEIINHFIVQSIQVIILCIFNLFIQNILLNLILYFLSGLVIANLLKGKNTMEFIMKPIKRKLIIILQYANTTNKIENIDLLMTYAVAREWIQMVYPEFYNQEDDFMYRQYGKKSFLSE